MPNRIRELKGKGNTRKNYFKTFWTLTRCWHLIWNSRQLWLFFTFVIFHQATEDQRGKNTNVKSWAHWDNSVHVKILWKKDSESSNYCSINIGTKLNLYISVDHSVTLPQIVLEEKKINISLFSTLCVLFPKEWLFLVHRWIHYPRETVVYFKPVGPMSKAPRWDHGERVAAPHPSDSSFKNVFSCPAFVSPEMCPLVSNRSL